MRVQDLMTKRVKTIAPTATAGDARNVMRLHGIHHLVVTEGHRVVGVVSERDLGGRRGEGGRLNTALGELMNAPAVAVEPTTTVRQAANLMRGRSIGCLVIVESGRAVGIVTVSDLLELVGAGLDRGAATTTRWTLSHRAPHRKARTATGVW